MRVNFIGDSVPFIEAARTNYLTLALLSTKPANGAATQAHHTTKIVPGREIPIGADLTLDAMAQSVGLSTAHFARMFRKSRRETPHQFVLRQRIERAKAMLRAPDARVLDVAWPVGLKLSSTLRKSFVMCVELVRLSIRQDFLGCEATCALEIYTEDTPRLRIRGSPTASLARVAFACIVN